MIIEGKYPTAIKNNQSAFKFGKYCLTTESKEGRYFSSTGRAGGDSTFNGSTAWPFL
jgi:hypothetical protein